MNKTFYDSKAWNQVRLYIWRKQNCLCARCGRPVYVSGISPWMPIDKRVKGIVHHKVYLNQTNVANDDISLNELNLEGLCIDCHNKEHFGRKQSTKCDVMFDELGNLVPKK